MKAKNLTKKVLYWFTNVDGLGSLCTNGPKVVLHTSYPAHLSTPVFSGGYGMGVAIMPSYGGGRGGYG